MGKRYLTTGQAASLCSVTPDTVLKWTRSGLLRARRTPGGHHRIDIRDLGPFIVKSAGNQERPANVLVITNDLDVTHRLMAEAAGQLTFNLRFTTCEYDCSALINDFKPDLALLDCVLGSQLTRDFIDHITQDPRIPHVQIVLAVSDEDPVHKFGSLDFPRVRRPFSVRDISRCLGLKLDNKADPKDVVSTDSTES